MGGSFGGGAAGRMRHVLFVCSLIGGAVICRVHPRSSWREAGVKGLVLPTSAGPTPWWASLRFEVFWRKPKASEKLRKKKTSQQPSSGKQCPWRCQDGRSVCWGVVRIAERQYMSKTPRSRESHCNVTVAPVCGTPKILSTGNIKNRPRKLDSLVRITRFWRLRQHVRIWRCISGCHRLWLRLFIHALCCANMNVNRSIRHKKLFLFNVKALVYI